MKRLVSIAAIPLVTLLMLAGLVLLDPFAATQHLISRAFGAGPESAMVRLVYQDPATQEISRGEAPLSSLTSLARFWANYPDRRRVVIMGNSQMYTVILAPGEKLGQETEKTYPDLVFAHYGGYQMFYRMAAPNISYMEALWYLRYLLAVPEVRPNQLILQLNYETFRKSGVRDGMLELLAEPRFREAILRDIQADKPYSATFQQAVARYEERLARQSADKNPTARGHAAQLSGTGIAQSYGFGNWLESRVRDMAPPLGGSRDLHHYKSEALEALYLLRVHLLQIKPTTRRTLGGASLTLNLSSLEKIAALCEENGIQLVLFNAPQNPSAPLYRTENDRVKYQTMIGDVASRHHLRLYDFEHSIPNPCWGVWIEGADPIHFGREGHRRLAELFVQTGMIQARGN